MVNLSNLTFIQGDASQVKTGESVIVLEYWATWCPPCRQTIPHLSEVQTKYKNQNVVMIGITNEDNESQIRTFVKKMGSSMNYVVAIDAEGSLTNDFMGKYNITGIPHAFVLGKDGKVVWHGHPADPALEQNIVKAIAAPSAAPRPAAKASYTQDELSKMSIKDLKNILLDRGVGFSDCVEKTDLVKRVLESSR